MKGPGLRINFDAKRAWKCPACGKSIRLSGEVASQVCLCTNPPTWMRLQPDPPKPKFSFERISIPEPEPEPEEELPTAQAVIPSESPAEPQSSSPGDERPREAQRRPPQGNRGNPKPDPSAENIGRKTAEGQPRSRERQDRDQRRHPDRADSTRKENPGEIDSPPVIESVAAAESSVPPEAPPPAPPAPADPTLQKDEEFGAGLE